MKEIQVGLLGLGTVGSGVVRIITDHQERLIHQVGCPVKVTKVLVQNIEKEREVEVPSTLLTQDANEILDNPNIDVVIEVMGGIDDAKSYILQALKSGKHVVTANKDLMALHGAELLATAKIIRLIYSMRRVWQGNSNFTQYRRRTFLRSYYESNGNCKWNDKFYFDENVRRRESI